MQVSSTWSYSLDLNAWNAERHLLSRYLTRKLVCPVEQQEIGYLRLFLVAKDTTEVPPKDITKSCGRLASRKRLLSCKTESPTSTGSSWLGDSTDRSKNRRFFLQKSKSALLRTYVTLCTELCFSGKFTLQDYFDTISVHCKMHDFEDTTKSTRSRAIVFRCVTPSKRVTRNCERRRRERRKFDIFM